MKRKVNCLLILFFLIVGSVAIFSFTSNKIKQDKVRQSAVSYLMGNEELNEIPESIEIKYDKKTKIYVANVKFEKNPKIMHIFISPDFKVQD